MGGRSTLIRVFPAFFERQIHLNTPVQRLAACRGECKQPTTDLREEPKHEAGTASNFPRELSLECTDSQVKLNRIWSAEL
jgi:hypothetical protein